MRRLTIAVALLGTVLSVAGVVLADDIDAESVVAAVTVYGDRAEVTRAAELELTPGEHRIRFGSLPAALVQDSIRVAGEGTAKVRLGTVEIDRVWHGEDQSVAKRELETQIEALDDRLKEIEVAEGVIQRQLDFLLSAQDYSAVNVSKALAGSPDTALDIDEIVEFLGTRATAVIEEHLSIEKEKREVNRERDTLRRRLEQLGGTGRKQSVTALVDITAETEGTLHVELAYTVPGASWRPVYDARLAKDQKSVEVRYNAVVVQRTGEDWPDVKLRLSTAQPQIGAKVPELEPIRLALSPKVERRRGRMLGAKVAEEAGSLVIEEKLVRPSGTTIDGIKPYHVTLPAKVRTAAVESKGVSVLFDVPGTEHIPSDGNEHKTTITALTFGTELEHVAVPKLSPHVFLKAHVRNESKVPLLPGKVNTFVAGNYVGASQLESIAPKEKFDFGFGADQRVQIERKELRDVRGKSGLFKNKRRLARGYEFVVNNYRDEMTDLTLIDHIPVSQDERVEVTLTETSLAPKEKGEDGLLKWKVLLKPREELKFRFAYEVEHPKEIHIAGLE